MSHLKLYCSITIERDDAEIPVEVTGEYRPASRGRKAHPMDRFAEPDDPAEIEVIKAKVNGAEIDLTDKELEQAEEELWKAMEEHKDNDAENRAEALMRRQEDDSD